jgi:putative transposase
MPANGRMLMKKIRMPEDAYRSGAAFAVTIATHRRRRFLSRRDVADLCVESLGESAQRNGARVFAYCFMPDHAHLLASVPDGGLIDLIRQFKRLSSFRAKNLLGGFPLWQSRFFDRALRSDDSLGQLARYILYNPVRGRLVDRITDYPYSGWFAWPEMRSSGSEDPDLHLSQSNKFLIVLAD